PGPGGGVRAGGYYVNDDIASSSPDLGPPLRPVRARSGRFFLKEMSLLTDGRHDGVGFPI
ncbi:hypothetical protein, partial [Brevundimonas sp.]|uniref:hypothetical protein n=1 Tax=Brevundimonas sp. TaxID=1871086 RepID=UPI0025C6A153